MSQFKISSGLIALTILISLFGCETDIDVIAPKKDMTVVYGLLEANKTRNFIRINKAFIGEDSATVLAQEPGINEYSDEEIVEAWVRELDENGNYVKQWALQDTVHTSKEDGIFYNTENKIYYFDGALASDKVYELYLKIKPEGEDEKVVTAQSTLLTPSSGSDLLCTKPRLTAPCGSTSNDRDKGEVDWINAQDNSVRATWSVKWSAASNAANYLSYMRFYYRDIYADGTVIYDSVYLPVGTEKAEDNSSDVEFVVAPQELINIIAAAVPDKAETFLDDGTPLDRRVVNDTMQVFIEVASDELNTYIEINSPATDVVQEKPEYTNVNNGIGIFASRYITTTRRSDFVCSGRILNAASLEEFVYSDASNSTLILETKGFTNPRCINGNCN